MGFPFMNHDLVPDNTYTYQSSSIMFCEKIVFREQLLANVFSSRGFGGHKIPSELGMRLLKELCLQHFIVWQ